MSRDPAVSIIVVAYNMQRELPRTILSLSPAMQQSVSSGDYELIIVDNGSEPPVDVNDMVTNGANLRVLRIDNATPSPSRAVNLGIQAAAGDIVGVMIDGARLASPGLVRGVLDAVKLHRRAVVATLGFHLGPEVQMKSVNHGYNQEIEDRLLDKVNWTTDGYRLFEISVLAGSSRNGWFLPIAESNALFMSAELWRELDGFDERFTSPGGGLVNLDAYRRACESPDIQLVLLLGEGTFHQVHGGISTNAATPPFGKFHEEYKQIRGKSFSPPEIEPFFYGEMPEQALRFVDYSAYSAIQDKRDARGDRSFESIIPPHIWSSIQAGTLQTRYRDRAFLKDPFDVMLYLQLFQKLRPATVIEIGTREGGSALWFADTLSSLGLNPSIISIDSDPPQNLDDPRIELITGDANNLESCLDGNLLNSLDHPLLVTEDSAHTYETSLTVLRFFDEYLQQGDYIVIEDGIVNALPGYNYFKFDNGPNRAVATFLDETQPRYKIDEELCDFYGKNVTYNPNAWLKRMHD